MPRISVVLPVRNAAGTIERAVQSILDQTLRDIELIVIDDGSVDGTAGVVRRIHDRRLTLICQSHRHVAAAANAGTRHASAPLIARMDADDISHPRRLERQLELLERENLDVVGCQVRIVDESLRLSSGMSRYARWINEETLTSEQILALRFVELPLVNPTILGRRRYFDMGFREGALPEDYELMLRAAAAGLRFGKVAEVLFDWVDRPNRLTRTDERYSCAAFQRCREQYVLSGPLHGMHRVDVWGAGQTGKRWRRWLERQRIAVRRVYEVNPRKVGAVIRGASICAPESMPAADGTPLVIAVGAAGARELILPHIQSHGYVAGIDAWFVA